MIEPVEEANKFQLPQLKFNMVTVLVGLNVLIWALGAFLWIRTTDMPPVRADHFATAVDVATPLVQNVEELDVGGALALNEVAFNIRSQSAILVNLDTGDFLFNHNGDAQMYPASVTKIMTVLVGLLHAEGDQLVVRANFSELTDMGAAMVGFVYGETRTLSEILHGSMLPSGADATSTLAYHVAGSYDGFVDLMNETAERIGMRHTNFMNASGLHQEHHYTTAYDTVLLLQYAFAIPGFRDIFTARSYSFESFWGYPQQMFSTLYLNAPSMHVRGGEILGGKTGFTTPAGLCLASIATDGHYEYALVTFGAPADFESMPHIGDAFSIYDYFFNSD